MSHNMPLISQRLVIVAVVPPDIRAFVQDDATVPAVCTIVLFPRVLHLDGPAVRDMGSLAYPHEAQGPVVVAVIVVAPPTPLRTSRDCSPSPS
jgi:hypothetical protein